MTEEEVAVQFNGHKHEIASLKHRMDAVENQARDTQTMLNSEFKDLVLSIQKLALNMEQMAKEQANQSKRLENLEKEPVEKAKDLKKTIITAIVTAIIGLVIGALWGKVGM